MTTYPIIYADPAWEYHAWSGKGTGRSAEQHYSTQSAADIAALPVSSVAAKNAVLFMWATFPTLPQAFEVGAAWGFEYKTCAFVWLKRTTTGRHWHKGLGYYTMSNAEPCLLFTRGRPPSRLHKDIHQVIDGLAAAQEGLFPPLTSRIMAHSVKPEEAYRRIERMFAGPYLELYARHTRTGWRSLGNEIDGRDLKESLEALANESESG